MCTPHQPTLSYPHNACSGASTHTTVGINDGMNDPPVPPSDWPRPKAQRTAYWLRSPAKSTGQKPTPRHCPPTILHPAAHDTPAPPNTAPHVSDNTRRGRRNDYLGAARVCHTRAQPPPSDPPRVPPDALSQKWQLPPVHPVPSPRTASAALRRTHRGTQHHRCMAARAHARGAGSSLSRGTGRAGWVGGLARNGYREGVTEGEEALPICSQPPRPPSPLNNPKPPSIHSPPLPLSACVCGEREVRSRGIQWRRRRGRTPAPRSDPCRRRCPRAAPPTRRRGPRRPR